MITEIPEHLKELADKCNPKHVQVIQAILSGKFATNTRAYMSVYQTTSASTAGDSVYKMLQMEHCQELFQALRDFDLYDGILTRAEAMRILSDMARTNIGDLVNFEESQVGEDENGDPVYQSTWSFKDSANLSDAQKRSISELMSTKEGLKIKMHDQKSAIKQLAEMAGWDAAKKIEHQGSITHIESEYVKPTD